MMPSGEKHNTIYYSFASLKDKSGRSEGQHDSLEPVSLRKKPIFFQRTSFSV